MTTETDAAVRFEWDFYLTSAASPTGAAYDLPVQSWVLSEDMDRDNFLELELTMDWLPENVWEALDPRDLVMPAGDAKGPIRFQVREYEDGTTAPRAVLPALGSEGSVWPYDISRNDIDGTVKLRCVSGEVLMDEKIKLSSGGTDTAATTVELLTRYALNGVFNAWGLDYLVATSAIPVGDRRVLNAGESFLDLIRSELDAINARLYDYYGLTFIVEDRDAAWGAAVHLATAPNLQTGADPIVWNLNETVTRGNSFADGVLIKFDNTPNGGGITWQAAGTGFSDKGVFQTRDRAAPTGNVADKVRARSLIRGRDLDVIARARMDVRSRTPGVVWTMQRYIEGSIRAVEWRFPEGEMSLRMQS